MGKKKKKAKNKRVAVQGEILPARKTENGVARKMTIHSGPLPPAESFEHYEKILPGAADRILTMAESQSGHRQKIELRVVSLEGLRSILGIIFAFLVVVISMGSGIYLTIEGKTLVGILIPGAALASIVATFIYEKKTARTK